ncbi:HAD-IIIC family phosphatase [Helicobacter sp. MIT 11-5569]|uniref:HAD-IIIC family phosphatase n=1 Tax=Helicobacter sp. MIT 11-5569 TaxID=1548151 RepID=UPI00051F899A|nr:HAD-IIIC family phosphatase [Helicobacter sp. MIT 11-5569]TLD81173.1 HAD-IIIC family phosphatase [Helicobacter sp. MIT 11-5569]
MDIFANNLTRRQLIELSKENINGKTICVNVHRNHAFEPIQSIIKPFLNFSHLNVVFNIGSYDDSFMFENHQSCDLELLWIDLDNYRQNNALEHIFERVEYLRSISKSPILIIFLDIYKSQLLKNLDSIKSKFQSILDCAIFFISEMIGEMGLDSILDEAKSQITGMRLSNIACISVAQILGLSLIPSMILPTLKAIVLDLDNTLYGGILGEDGENALVYDDKYMLLHKEILKYKAQGFLLAIASKNYEEDVKNLFKRRQDFGLKWEDFDVKKVSWNPKRQSIQEIAKALNIGLDSILFIDDNPAEIENVRDLGVKVILAKSPIETLQILRLFPQMLKLTSSKEDLLRSKDIQANFVRQELSNLSPESYFKKLEIQLEFRVNAMDTLPRVTELLNKTNQFIANYTRPTQEVVRDWFADEDICIITIAMKDKLSDSGIIGIFIGFKDEKNLHIIDLCVSCRALGRKLEKIMFFKACGLAQNALNINGKIIISYQKGERNLPFLDFLNTLHTEMLESDLACVEFENIEECGLNINIRR